MKLEKFYNKKEKKEQYKVRFQFNKKEFYLSADTKSELKDLIEEVRVQERRVKLGLETTPIPAPTMKDLFDTYLPRIRNEKHREISKRVFREFLERLPEDIKINEIKQKHFQIYADWRRNEINIQSGKNVTGATINKEMYAVRAALKSINVIYPHLDEYEPPSVPRIKVKRERRERLVDLDKELYLLLAELRKDKTGKQTNDHVKNRRRLADELEFRYETGMRTKEVINLRPEQYDKKDKALRFVKRFKTNSVTKFLPLSARAAEIVESRLKNLDSEFIFSDDGKPKNNNYYTLKSLCEKLGLTYGRYKDGGFVAHDLRHNFATEILEVTDIETARTLTGHAGAEIFTYVHTSEKKQREAIAKRQKDDKISEFVALYKGVRRKKIKVKEFLEKVKNLTKK